MASVDISPSSETTIYSAFNARNLNPREVARTFVPPDEFKDLVKNQHTVLMGPRGSGKTTMIKMLTPEGLRSWEEVAPDGDRIRPAFTGVYIPTDIHWHSQIVYAENLLNQTCRNFGEEVSGALVTINVLQALVSSMQDRIKWELQLDAREPAVVEFWSRVVDVWSLQLLLPTYSAVSDALHKRMSWIANLVRRSRFNPSLTEQEIGLTQWVFDEHLPMVSSAVSIFDDIFSDGQKQKWALCFDELELAPNWLQNVLIKKTRSTTEQLLFKLSTSPIPSIGPEDGQEATGRSMEKHDFKVVFLWPYSGKQYRNFCRKLTAAVLEQRGVTPANPQRLFGRSPLSTDNIDDAEDDYSRNDNPNSAYNVIKEVAAMDSGLRDLLLHNGIDPKDPWSPDPKKREEVLYKIKPTAYLRREMRKLNKQGRLVGRSRKTGVYWGEEAIYAVSDGNPRWLIGILDELLQKKRVDKSGFTIPLTQRHQAAVLYSVSRRFSTLLTSLPHSETTSSGRTLQLPAILEEVGEYFYYHTVQAEKFPLDPVGSFIVDSWVPEGVVELLRDALYYGAIVYANPYEHVPFGSLRGRRFRLSYGLSPTSVLPLRLNNPVMLHRCSPTIRRLRAETQAAEAAHDEQGILPFDDQAETQIAEAVSDDQIILLFDEYETDTNETD